MVSNRIKMLLGKNQKVFSAPYLLKLNVFSIVGIGVVILVALLALSGFSSNVNNSIADSLIRLHVVANSDSQEDQALKQVVKDDILSYMRDRTAYVEDIALSREIVKSSIPELTELAKQTIKKHNKDYDVNVYFGEMPFPTKEYADISLPAGVYEALKVVIGKGEGRNWWCVLFPPLCFIDSSAGKLPDSSMKILEENMTKDNLEMIENNSRETKPVIKIKFKIVEFFQNTKNNFIWNYKK